MERLPFASQSVWLDLVRHGADMSQTQLRWSLLRCESRSAVLPPSSGAAWQGYIFVKCSFASMLLLGCFPC